jgi:hypothetical protein
MEGVAVWAVWKVEAGRIVGEWKVVGPVGWALVKVVEVRVVEVGSVGMRGTEGLRGATLGGTDGAEAFGKA